MGELLKIVHAHLQSIAGEIIPYIVHEYSRHLGLFATAPKMPPMPGLDESLREGFRVLIGDLSPHLQRTFRRNGHRLLRQFKIGVEHNHVIDYRAIRYATERGASLITELTDHTREAVKNKLIKALENGWSAPQLAQELRDDDMFNPVRALRIARTELQESYRQGGKNAARIAEAKLQKWDSAVDSCEECRENSDAGWIPFDSDFPNGESPHPSCSCTIDYELSDQAPSS